MELDDSSITDHGFYGAFVELKGGWRALAMPVSRSEFEHDSTAPTLVALELRPAATPERLTVSPAVPV